MAGVFQPNVFQDDVFQVEAPVVADSSVPKSIKDYGFFKGKPFVNGIGKRAAIRR